MSVNCADNYFRLRKKSPKSGSASSRKERNLSIKKISAILQKKEADRTKEEEDLLFTYSEVVDEAAVRLERKQKLKERLQEFEETEADLDYKCKVLAEAVAKAKNLVVYTGAGISTAARIPDYRGTSGIWTLLQQGKDIGSHDLTQAEPTYTHMALSRLYTLGKLKHVVSQNCDGLHLRSGLPRTALSEVHGNMYIEVCKSCRPIIEYLRLFDVTENTGRYSHKTLRRCYRCEAPLIDSIVHFGERGTLPWPLNWKGACRAAENADTILCIGSSLKVLKRYPWLWAMDKPAKRRPHLYIVNLQWTPKDCHATIKINGKCDEVMRKLMKCLAIEVDEYSRDRDPIFRHATELCKEEQHTTNRPCLVYVKDEKHISTSSSFALKEPKEEVTDMSQGLEKYIFITIKSEQTEPCCEGFQQRQTHDVDCTNYIDDKTDIPVIIAPPAPPPFNPYLPVLDPSLLALLNPNYIMSNLDIVLPTLPGHKVSIKREFPETALTLKRPKLDTDVKPRVGLMTNRNTDVSKLRCRDVRECSYCRSQYSSCTCLFYTQRKPTFKSAGNVCECCSDEQGTDEEDEKSSDAPKTSTSNPGWYGKGYRKFVKKKR